MGHRCFPPQCRHEPEQQPGELVLHNSTVQHALLEGVSGMRWLRPRGFGICPRRRLCYLLSPWADNLISLSPCPFLCEVGLIGTLFSSS